MWKSPAHSPLPILRWIQAHPKLYLDGSTDIHTLVTGYRTLKRTREKGVRNLCAARENYNSWPLAGGRVSCLTTELEPGVEILICLPVNCPDCDKNFASTDAYQQVNHPLTPWCVQQLIVIAHSTPLRKALVRVLPCTVLPSLGINQTLRIRCVQSRSFPFPDYSLRTYLRG